MARAIDSVFSPLVGLKKLMIIGKKINGARKSNWLKFQALSKSNLVNDRTALVIPQPGQT